MSDSNDSTPMQETASSGYIPTLDGWRAVAISLVLADHALNNLATSTQDLVRWKVPPALGQHGVGLFFALSGFLITSRLLDENALRGRISLRDFYIRRAFRILPAALVVLAALAGLGVAGWLPIGRSEVFGALFFYRNYLPSISAPNGTGFFTSHYWSLAVEEHFYLIWPVLLMLGLRYRQGLVVGLACAGLLVAWRQLELAREIGTYGRVLPTFFVRSDTRMDALLWGAVAALILDARRAREWAARYFTTIVWLGVVGLYLAVWLRYRTQPTCWEGMLAAMLVAGTAVRPNGPAGRALEVPLLRWVGRISYSLYLTNQAFLPFQSIGIPITLGVLQHVPFNVAAVLASSIALYYLIERPMIRAGHRFAKPVRHGRPSHAPRPLIATPVELPNVVVS